MLSNHTTTVTMKVSIFKFLYKYIWVLLIVCCPVTANAQDEVSFWDKVRFGGTAGAAFGNGYTDVVLAPGALYQVNNYVGVGVGLQGSYVKFKDFYTSYIYGASVIGIFSPIQQVQLSAEIEQLRVNLNYSDDYYTPTAVSPTDRNFWNTALFLGAGYNTGNVTIGLRYNVLFREKDRVYSDALMPFVRVYF